MEKNDIVQFIRTIMDKKFEKIDVESAEIPQHVSD